VRQSLSLIFIFDPSFNMVRCIHNLKIDYTLGNIRSYEKTQIDYSEDLSLLIIDYISQEPIVATLTSPHSKVGLQAFTTPKKQFRNELHYSFLYEFRTKKYTI
jgi:hypothetical protein